MRYYLYEHVFPGVMGLSDSLLSCTAQELIAPLLVNDSISYAI